MKYAFMTWSCPDSDLDSVLAMAKRFDYEAVELRIGRGRHYGFETGHEHGVEINTDAQTRSAIKQKIVDSGIIACCIATSCNYADPAVADKHVDETIESIDLASDLGITRLRVFGGVIPENVTREQAADKIVASLKKVADHANQRDVIVCMETHDHWCDPTHVAQLMERVNHPAIAVNWDIMHPVRSAGFTMDLSYEILKPWIKHVHIHDGSKRMDEMIFKAIGEGDIDHNRALELLIADGYDGYLSGEWIDWEPWETHLPRERETMRALESQIGAV
jgi:sugar phosphate isomerase/epimerase